jgi:periplasmic protein TonB
MTPETVAAQGFDNSRRRVAPHRVRSRRLLLSAVAVSVLVHLMPIGLFIFLPPAPPKENNFENQGTVELLMVEQKGAKPSLPGQIDAGTSQANELQVGKPSVAAPENAEKAPTNPVVEGAANELAPLTPPAHAMSGAQPEPPQPESPPAPPKSQAAPVFNFAGTDSDTNAMILSGRILPAMPDDRFRNRPPAYPRDAVMRGEVGAVLVIIHVSAYGVATGADVAESSGSPSLDKAAVAAVRKWRFRPAMKEGLAVPFDMPFRFIFSAD